ncbi:hypothetical protein FHS96_004960 [Sphingomonas zeicaulis]|uniref:hypothetical protein n=1 Tax=Sphingomonas zeicaulis TaxID=1632740 RepID=UPI003D1E530F
MSAENQRSAAARNRQPWTTTEEATLRATYRHGVDHAMAALPHRTRMAIYMRAKLLGLAEQREMWTGREVAIIRRVYPTQGSRAVQALLPHRSIEKIQHVARRVGIRREGRRWTWRTKAEAL